MKRLGVFLQEYGVIVALVALFGVNLLERGTEFLQPEILRNMVSQNAYTGIIAIGMTLVIMTGGIDLSVGSLVALCGAVGIIVLNGVGANEASTTLAIALAGCASLAVGTVAGFLNGFTIAYGRVAPFIVTLAGLAAFRSLALVLGNGGEIRSTVESYKEIGFGGIPIPGLQTAVGDPLIFYWHAILFLLIACFASFLLNRTAFGRHVIAVGANERAAHYSAVNTRRVKVFVYTLTGALTGIAAFTLSAKQNSIGTGSAGLYYELDAIAAVVIGGTSLRGGRGRIWGTVVGVVLLTLITATMTTYRVNTNWQGVVRGAVILIAVLMQRGARAND